MTRNPISRNMVLFGDCVKWLKRFDNNTFTAVVTDPPYGLEFMGKDWDAPWRANWQSGGGFSKPGIGERKTEWPSFSSMSPFGGSNPTCGKCGGRARGANKCNCESPQWKLIGNRRNPENKDLPDDVTGGGMAYQMRLFQQWTEAWAKEVIRVLKPGGHLLSFAGTRTYHRMTCGIEEAGFQIRDKIDYYCELQDAMSWTYGQGFPKSLNIGKSIAALEIEGNSSMQSRRKVAMGEDYVESETVGKTDVGAERSMRCVRSSPPEQKQMTEEAKKWEGYGTALKPAHEPVAVFGKSDEEGVLPKLPESDAPFCYEAKASTRERNYGCRNMFWLTTDEGTKQIEKEEYIRLAKENSANKSKEGYVPHRVSHGNIWATVKPIELCRYLVRMVKMPGDNLILDPFCGSGTTAIACILEGCDFLTMDNDPVAYEIAKTRIHYFQCLGKKGLK